MNWERFRPLWMWFLEVPLIYFTIARENRESFFNFIFEDKKIKKDDLNIFLEKINEEFNIFHPTKNQYIFDTVYSYRDKTISAKIINSKIEKLEELLRGSEKIKSSYSETKQQIDKKIGVRAFGEAASKFNGADITYNHDTFFRLPLDERVF